MREKFTLDVVFFSRIIARLNSGMKALAVGLQLQGAGLVEALLKVALLCTAQAANIAGIRALLAHAKDEPVRQWYLDWEFEPSPSDLFHRFLLVKDIKAMVGKA
jgi:hypothetical protein